MAEFHLQVKIISRGSGKSAVAAAAYRSRSEIMDERQGLTFDYSAVHEQVAFSAIMTPANAPEWAQDRAKLWNEVERCGNRIDARLAREIEIALPIELSRDQNIELLKEFVQSEFVNQGMIADVNYHASETNPHAHIMLTTRRINPDGFGPVETAWNKRDNTFKWRKAWEDHGNRHLQLAGLDVRIDCRSFKDRGLNLEPSKKIGIAKSNHHMSDGLVKDLDRVKINQEIAQRNGERIIQDPKIALDEISYHQAVFSEKDIAKFANRHSVDPDQFDQVQQSIMASPELINLGRDDKGEYRFTTKTNLEAEKKMMADALAMDTAAGHQVKDAYLNQAMAVRSLTQEQSEAVKYVLESGDVSCMIGFAGAGKSYTLGAVREAYEAAGYQCKGMALSGIAAEGLEVESGIKSKTIHRTLWDIENKREQFTGKDVLFVDEAGMVATRQMQQIIGQARTAGAKVVLVGDPHQLQPIEAGGAFRGILDRVGYVELSEVRRQSIDWQKQATKDFTNNKTSEALEAYNTHGHIKSFEKIDQAKEDLISAWLENRQEAHAAGTGATSIILAYRNADVKDLNDKARSALKQTGRLKGQDFDIETGRGKRSICAGDRVLFLRNEKSLGVKNGSLGTVERIDRTGIQVKLDAGRRLAFDPNMYRDFDHGYAATVHKTQGSTLDNTFILATRHFDRHTALVAMSRHREDVRLFFSQDEFNNFEDLKQVMGRDRPKDLVVDYARNRGINIGEDLQAQAWEKELTTAAAVDKGKVSKKLTAADIARQQMEHEQHWRAILTAPGRSTIEHDLSAPADLKGEDLDKYLKEQIQKYVDRNPLIQAEKLSVKFARVDRDKARDRDLTIPGPGKSI
jgi:Ti-type conjugative transfer relaxase TraA